MYANTGLSGISALIGGGLTADADADSYISRTGITNIDRIEEMEGLYLDLKAEGFYDTLDVGWIGRSGYNVGSGTEVQEMKGTTNNGILTGSDLWTTDGLAFDNLEYMSSPYMMDMDNNPVGWSYYVIFKIPSNFVINTAVVGTNGIFAPSGSLLFMSNWFQPTATRCTVSDGTTHSGSSSDINVSSFFRLGLCRDTHPDIGLRWWKQGEATFFSETSLAFSASTHPVYLNSSYDFTGDSQKVIAVFMLFRQSFSAADYQTLDSIVLDRIGAGLV